MLNVVDYSSTVYLLMITQINYCSDYLLQRNKKVMTLIRESLLRAQVT